MRHVPSSPADGSGSDGSEAGDGSPEEPANMEPTSLADGSDGVRKRRLPPASVSPFDVRDGPEGKASSRPCSRRETWGAWCERAWGSFADEEGDSGGEDDGQDERGCSGVAGSKSPESPADGSETPESPGDDSRSSSESEPCPVRLVAKRRQLADGSENIFPVDGEKGLPCIMFGYRFPRPIMSHIGLLGFFNAAKLRVLDLAAQKTVPWLFCGTSQNRRRPPSHLTSRWQWADWRKHEVMGMVLHHNNEYRRWRPQWGCREIDVFTKFHGDVPKELASQRELKVNHDMDAPFLRPEASRWRLDNDITDIDFDNAESTIVLPSVDGDGQWGRDVLIVSLPQLFVFFSEEKTAEEIREAFLLSPIVVRAHARGKGKQSSASSQPTATTQALADSPSQPMATPPVPPAKRCLQSPPGPPPGLKWRVPPLPPPPPRRTPPPPPPPSAPQQPADFKGEVKAEGEVPADGGGSPPSEARERAFRGRRWRSSTSDDDER